jgi:hypothetical protein
MEKFYLPMEYLNAHWQTKHIFVREFVNRFVNKKKKSIGYKHGQSLWNTSLVLELLDLLNLEPTNPHFAFIKYSKPFEVRCLVHESFTFKTSIAKIRKGQICKQCLSTFRLMSQEEAEAEAEAMGYLLVDKYTGYHNKHNFICPAGHPINMRFHLIYKGCCDECGKKRKREKLRTPFNEIEELFLRINSENPKVHLLTNRIEYEEYEEESASFQIRYTCSLCGREKSGTLQDIKAGNLMHKKCAGKYVNSKKRLSYDEVCARFAEKSLRVITSKEKFESEYENNLYEIEYFCENCKKHNGPKRVADILVSGCPVCNPNYYNKTKHLRQKWSVKIKAKNDDICINCGYKGPELESHHLFDRRNFPQFADSLWNGKPLCPYCHRLCKYSFHKYVKKNKYDFCTPHIFIEWLEEWGDKCKELSHNIHYGSLNTNIISPKDVLPYKNDFL